jgi:hypothetical protein
MIAKQNQLLSLCVSFQRETAGNQHHPDIRAFSDQVIILLGDYNLGVGSDGRFKEDWDEPVTVADVKGLMEVGDER